jgi:hypothetical protein
VTSVPAGATNLRVANIAGFVAGETMQVMEYGGSNFESASVVRIGTAAGPPTTVAVRVPAGATNIKVANVNGFVVGEELVVGVGKRQEIRTVTGIGTAGAEGTGVTISAPLSFVHYGLDRIRGTGTGIDVSPLARAHRSGSATRGQGTGITVSPLTMDHDLGKTGTGQGQGQAPGAGKSIRGTGTGVTLATPLSRSHGGSVVARGTGTGIGVTSLSAAHQAGEATRGVGTGVTLSAALVRAHNDGVVVRDQSKPGTGITLDRPLGNPHAINAVVRVAGTGISLTTPATKAHRIGEQVGASSMTVDEARTHMSIWAMVASPLVVGAEIPNMQQQNLEIYLNRDVIAVNQDSLGIQAFTVSNAGNQWIFRKPLANGDVAVAFWNDATVPWTGATATFAQLELDPAGSYSSRDLWTKQTTNLGSGTVNAPPIPAHATVMLRITRRQSLMRMLLISSNKTESRQKQ